MVSLCVNKIVPLLNDGNKYKSLSSLKNLVISLIIRHRIDCIIFVLLFIYSMNVGINITLCVYYHAVNRQTIN